MATGRTKRGQFTSNREQRRMDPDTEGGFQVSRRGEQGEQGEPCTYVTFIPYMYAMNE